MNYHILKSIKKNREENKIISYEDKDVTIDIINKYFNKNFGFNNHKQDAIDLLQLTINILNEFNIKYSLISGTLLGLIRHDDFIPWDDDIDLLVDSSIKNNIPFIIEKYPNINLIINDIFIKISLKNSDNNWPFIDLFMFKDVNIENIEFFGKIWEKNKFFPTNTISFLNMNVEIPNNPIYFLELNYSKDCLTTLVSDNYNHINEEFRNKNNKIKISLKIYNKILKHI